MLTIVVNFVMNLNEVIGTLASTNRIPPEEYCSGVVKGTLRKEKHSAWYLTSNFSIFPQAGGLMGSNKRLAYLWLARNDGMDP